MEVFKNIDLLPFNTFGLSCIAESLVNISTREGLPEYFEGKGENPALVLGGGSNLLLTQNIPGRVLKVEIPGIELIREDEEHVYVKVGAGVVWHEFVLHCIQNNWAGVENLSLIPGNVGAAPMQNIGAYGMEIKKVFHELEAYLTDDKCWQAFDLPSCHFGVSGKCFLNAP